MKPPAARRAPRGEPQEPPPSPDAGAPEPLTPDPDPAPAAAAPLRLIAPGTEQYGGRSYMRDARGSLIPYEMVKPVDILEDQLVRRLFAAAAELAEVIAKFKAKTFDDVDAFGALIAEKYGAKAVAGGAKGNITLATYDGRLRVQVQVADIKRFGSALRVAETLLYECAEEWSTDARPELKVIVDDAFQTDKEGNLSASRIFGLLRHNITDPRWLEAMNAIRDSIVVDRTKRYVRFHSRASADAGWVMLSLDAATA